MHLGDIDAGANGLPSLSIATGEQGTGFAVVNDVQEPVISREIIVTGGALGVFMDREALAVGGDTHEGLLVVEQNESANASGGEGDFRLDGVGGVRGGSEQQAGVGGRLAF